MEYQKIEIKIDKQGNITLETSGVKGKKCTSITKELEKLLGNVTKRDLKAEYYDDGDDTNDNYLTTSN